MPSKADIKIWFAQNPWNSKRTLKKFTANPNENYDFAHEPAQFFEEADVITSEGNTGSGQHYPVLDLDIPHQYYESTTPGHGHLYIDHPISWRDYKRLLRILARAGIIEEGYYSAALSRGYTSVRVPWRRKGEETVNG